MLGEYLLLMGCPTRSVSPVCASSLPSCSGGGGVPRLFGTSLLLRCLARPSSPISSPAWRAAAVTLAVGEMKLAAGTCIFFLKTQPFKDMMSLNKHSKVTLFSPRGAVPEPGSGIPGGRGGVSRRAVCWSAPSPSSGSWPQALRTRCGCPGPGGWSPSSRCLK